MIVESSLSTMREEFITLFRRFLTKKLGNPGSVEKKMD